MRLDVSLGQDGIYFDQDKSGMRNIVREGYEHLLSDVRSGKLAGRFIVVREQERLSRRESSVLEAYHVATERAKVRTFESPGREIKDDLVTGIIAVVRREEARSVGVKQKARKELRAILGLPPAGRLPRIGYTPGYKAIDWEQAKMLRRIRRKFVAGQSLTSIRRELTSQGVRRPNGEPFQTADLSRILRSPEYAGLRVFTRDIVHEGVVIRKGDVVSKGIWPKIFTEEEHYEPGPTGGVSRRHVSTTRTSGTAHRHAGASGDTGRA